MGSYDSIGFFVRCLIKHPQERQEEEYVAVAFWHGIAPSWPLASYVEKKQGESCFVSPVSHFPLDFM